MHNNSLKAWIFIFFLSQTISILKAPNAVSRIPSQGLLKATPAFLASKKIRVSNQNKNKTIGYFLNLHLAEICFQMLEKNTARGSFENFAGLNLKIASFSFGNSAIKIFDKIEEILKGGAQIQILIGDNMCAGKNALKHIPNFKHGLSFEEYVWHLKELGAEIKFFDKRSMHLKFLLAYSDDFFPPKPEENIKKIFTSKSEAIMYWGTANLSKSGTEINIGESGTIYVCSNPRFKPTQSGRLNPTSCLDKDCLDEISFKMSDFHYSWSMSKPIEMLDSAK